MLKKFFKMMIKCSLLFLPVFGLVYLTHLIATNKWRQFAVDLIEHVVVGLSIALGAVAAFMTAGAAGVIVWAFVLLITAFFEDTRHGALFQQIWLYLPSAINLGASLAVWSASLVENLAQVSTLSVSDISTAVLNATTWENSIMLSSVCTKLGAWLGLAAVTQIVTNDFYGVYLASKPTIVGVTTTELLPSLHQGGLLRRLDSSLAGQLQEAFEAIDSLTTSYAITDPWVPDEGGTHGINTLSMIHKPSWPMAALEGAVIGAAI